MTATTVCGKKLLPLIFMSKVTGTGPGPMMASGPGRIERSNRRAQVVHLERDRFTRDLRQQADIAHSNAVEATKSQRLRRDKGFQQSWPDISRVNLNPFNSSRAVEKNAGALTEAKTFDSHRKTLRN